MLLKSFLILALPYYIFHHTYSLNLFDSSVLTRTILFDSSELATLPHQARQPKHGSSPLQGSYVFNLISIQKPKMCHLIFPYYWCGTETCLICSLYAMPECRVIILGFWLKSHVFQLLIYLELVDLLENILE